VDPHTAAHAPARQSAAPAQSSGRAAQPIRAQDLSDDDLARAMDRIRLDEILAKVGEVGRDALTADEAEFLESMSRKLRERGPA